MTIRLEPQEEAMFEAMARAANVAVGAFIRESALRGAPTVARELRNGDLRLRRQTVGKVETLEDAGRVEKLEKVETATKAARGQVRPARAWVPPSDRQVKLNKAKERGQ